jgi:thiamine-monophosphate kinase
LVIGHRGASAIAPENSVAAFARARADGADGVELDVMICGTVPAGRAVLRSGARPGDVLFVSGQLGATAAALARNRPLPPVHPRLELGRYLREHHLASAMIDLSDGLGSDAGHLAAASDVGVEVDLAALPVLPALRGGTGHEPAAVFAARGGEDYELLVTLPAVFGEAETDRFRRDCGIPLTCVGRVVVGTGARLLLDGQPIAARGFDHFA